MSPLRLPWLDGPSDAPFPDPSTALREPDGLLAAGGDLHPSRLLAAYRAGIFPWFSDGEPPLWWSPDPRVVFRTDRVAASRRFRRGLRTSTWTVRADTAFDTVIALCAEVPRRGPPRTRLTRALQGADFRLPRPGHPPTGQVGNPHLLSLGAEAWARDAFLGAVAGLVDQPGLDGPWTVAFGELPASDLAHPPP